MNAEKDTWAARVFSLALVRPLPTYRVMAEGMMASRIYTTRIVGSTASTPYYQSLFYLVREGRLLSPGSCRCRTSGD